MIGRVLDKYEILEEVGQGGMSVVYKGMDTSLHREVAVKVLHPHLASHEEARARFEREAQAVAKLRHENILEIFDYSGRASIDSYIVTEFIRGRTLKEFITAHRLAFPEVGAMIVAEVCRALAHAHALGVLHRDVKPENIMIRDDGMVKLMDFGIAQIVDAQRMTVTGQLLGSPAYMSPEHVEGKPLDFRTDVFSVGILLYQLSTAELPFKGRNPHEILKRIAECKFLDARVVNPLVGERLGRIIAKALAHDPDDRFADVTPMLDDLLRYLGEAELGEPRAELARFFPQPVPYEQALRQRLISALTKRGKNELVARHMAAALELFNRVLTIDPANEEVLKEIDRLSRRKRAVRGLVFGLALASAVAGAATVKFTWFEKNPGAAGGAQPFDAQPVDSGAPVALMTYDAMLAMNDPFDAAVALVDLPDAAGEDDGPPDAGTRIVKTPPDKRRADAGLGVAIGPTRTLILRKTRPKRVSYSVDNGSFVELRGGQTSIPISPGLHRITAKNDACCTPHTFDVPGTAPSEHVLELRLEFKPATLKISCAEASSVTVNGVDFAKKVGAIPIEPKDFNSDGEARIPITFSLGETKTKTKTVHAGQTEEFKCTDEAE